MKYFCESCNYETENKTSWYKHKLTIRHKKLTDIKENNEINKTQTEKLIKNHEIELLQEKLKFLEAEKNIMVNQLMKAENQLVKTEKQLDDIKNNYEKQINSNKIFYEKQIQSNKIQYENHIDTLKKENDFQKQIINSAGGVIQKSMNTLSFLLLNYKNAPCLNNLNDYSIISKNVDFLIKDLIFYYRKDTLDKYFGDFIVKHYKKDKPELQSIWNSDTERLNYFIRELTNCCNSDDITSIKKNNLDIQWIIDKKGLKMTKYIINPLLDYICVINVNYINQKHKENEKSNYKKIDKILKDMETIACINNDIKNNILSKNINKYVAPHFYFDKNKII